MITARRLMACGLTAKAAERFAAPMAEACSRLEINTPERLAAFIAQCRVESAEFTRFEEGLYYRDAERVARIFRTAFDLDRDRVVDPEEIEFARAYLRQPEKLANRIYANRLGNGDEASGDGWRYRGRGAKQLTGRANYAEAAQDLGRPYVEQPDLVAQDPDACLTAAWFWHKSGCSAMADQWRLDDITRAVNGPGMLKREERAMLARVAHRQLLELA
jgi:putative chitinase